MNTRNLVFSILISLLYLMTMFSCQDKPKKTAKDLIDPGAAELLAQKDSAASEILFIGTYTRKEPHVNGKAEGIYVYKMSKSTGRLTHHSTFKGSINPSYLTVHPNKRFLYAVNEHGGAGEFETGTVSAFSIHPESKELDLINIVSAEGVAPCYISVDKSGHFALVANYVGGNTVLLPIQIKGALGKAVAVEQHEGKGEHPRQDAPHAHFVDTDPNNRYVYAVDLGLDKILRYELDKRQGKLKPAGAANVTPQAGCRHLTFHPQERWAYVINELNGTIEAFQVDEKSGQMEQFQTIPTTESATTEAACADIHITPSGRFLYATNRGMENSIAIFSIDRESGELTNIGYQSTFGKTPRNFVIDPSGTFLLVANQDSDNVVTFKIDEKTGQLTETGLVAEIPTPVCLKFW